MRFQTLQQWLDWQETLHPQEVDLKLERVRQVLRRLGWERPPWTVVTVAGTNGKGSCVGMLETILHAQGYCVGTYTSPHLVRYTERIRRCGVEVDERELCAVFDRVDRARDDLTLTYFEFGTVAALELFRHTDLDMVVLEVGLGGRLDAVNAIDPTVALVTTVDVDHVAWLGPDRERIGREKAGVFRPGRTAVYGDLDPPASLLDHASRVGTRLHRLGRDFWYEVAGDRWTWWSRWRRYSALPLPSLFGAYQLQNAAAVLAVLESLHDRHPVTIQALRRGLEAVRLPGRYEVLSGSPTLVLDVAHNVQAVRALAENLKRTSVAGHTHAVIAVLNDKDVEGMLEAIATQVAFWHVAGLEVSRGLSSQALSERFGRTLPGVPRATYRRVAEALAAAFAVAGEHDRIVVFGSFHTVSQARQMAAVGCERE